MRTPGEGTWAEAWLTASERTVYEDMALAEKKAWLVETPGGGRIVSIEEP